MPAFPRCWPSALQKDGSFDSQPKAWNIGNNCVEHGFRLDASSLYSDAERFPPSDAEVLLVSFYKILPIYHRSTLIGINFLKYNSLNFKTLSLS